MLRDGVQPDDLKPDTLRACLGILPEPEVPIEVIEHAKPDSDFCDECKFNPPYCAAMY